MRFTAIEIVNHIKLYGPKTVEELKEHDRSRGLSMKPIDYERALNEAVDVGALKIEGDKYVYINQENK